MGRLLGLEHLTQPWNAHSTYEIGARSVAQTEGVPPYR